MKRLHKIICSLCCLLFVLSGCGETSSEPTTTWGSFTAEKTYSYDEKYYAIQETEPIPGDSGVPFVKVCIYETETDTQIYSFNAARARDFWGICWEKDSYDIWIQSADIGIYCYRSEDMCCKLDESAERPEYIVSKWDK